MSKSNWTPYGVFSLILMLLSLHMIPDALKYDTVFYIFLHILLLSQCQCKKTRWRLIFELGTG